MKTVYYTASSLDGFIVDTDDSLDWLLSRDIDQQGPFGYDGFIKTIGALVMGSATYEWLVKNQPGEWAYGQPAWVLTHRPQIISAEHPVQVFFGDIAELHPRLVAAAAGKDVWVMGGGEVAAQFVAAGLIDEMIVSYAPCSLGAGSPVLPVRSEWALAESALNGDFVCARWVRAQTAD
ncbi:MULTISPECIES: dihydrofolate reductase family protein [unclassified Mycolicibacterium]|uniref:dihydrofolate reductase family protein n=1 Tax=unclassified Mycolicibacterium TaxID=2636767 RepID=UPI00130BF5C3|nr:MULTISPECIES: dihydrofolate reductase family protein [unclassified Mycolicibacterium]MUL82657.1 dihydrofolate reductase [Mycolicibacterium sp. CBMA 329]MUL88992.1 dihydrofolate reductase [Mycolicibacterium sp. CBMA 331]MUL97559.1 dihydrofolate reductase [Mycolicibacterium sp. CBMA 334]MUM27189.1 dihydrofolate reductase [Mycolicibacterium sp. CBMA 295]MUM38508.1 dihydrofolate reductase [Mycolicibacterium sp. CBMA 247]